MLSDTYHTNFSKLILQRNSMDESIHCARKAGDPVVTEHVSLG